MNENNIMMTMNMNMNNKIWMREREDVPFTVRSKEPLISRLLSCFV